MKKSSTILSFILATLFSITFVSAAMNYYGGFGGFLRGVGEETIVFLFFGIIIFAVAFFTLSKVFKGNNAIAGIVSGAIAMLGAYYSSQWSVLNNIHPDKLLFSLGVSSNFLYTLVPILVAIGLLISFFTLGIRWSFCLLFGIVFLLSISGFFYNSTLVGVVSLIGLVVFGWLSVGRWRRDHAIARAFH